jgi:Uma2 family endonuclease
MSTVATTTESLPVVLPFQPKRMTVAEYHELIRSGGLKEGARFEMLKGVLAEKLTHNPLHAGLLLILQQLLLPLLPVSYLFRCQLPITLADSEPEPDISIARGEAVDCLKRHPGPADVPLVIEISVSSLLTDRYKAEIYAEARIPYYWIIDPVNRQVECYSKPESTAAGFRYSDCQRLGPGDSIPVIIDSREIGKLAAAQLLPVVP